MANISTAMSLLAVEGVGSRCALYRVTGATSSDSVVVTTSFSLVTQAVAMPTLLSTLASTVGISGTTVTFTLPGMATDTLYLLVVGPGV